MISRSPRQAMPQYTLTAALSWFQTAFTSIQHSRSHETSNKLAYTIPIHSQLLGQTGLLAGHQLLVQEVSKCHHPSMAVKEVIRGNTGFTFR